MSRFYTFQRCRSTGPGKSVILADMTEHAEVARRRARVLAMRAMGMSNQAIAEQEARETGKKPRPASAVSVDYRAALKESKTDRDDLRDMAGTLEAERLDRLQQTVETLLRAEAQQGRCNLCGRTGEPQMVLRAANQLVRIAERRAALLGLDLKGKDMPGPPVEDELAKIRNRIHSEHPRQGSRRQGKTS
jgi:hypothetical protein